MAMPKPINPLVCHSAARQGNKRTALLRYGMTFRRTPPSPPKEDPPSVLLMRAIGDLQCMEGGEPITDMEVVALMCGLVWIDLPALLEGGGVAGYLDDDGDGGIGLSEKGHRWYDRDLLRRE